MEDSSSKNPEPPSARPAPTGLSVLVPCYNEAAGLSHTINELKQVLETVDLPSEIIVIDDGSTDGTTANLESGKVRILRHEQNRGYGAALKTGAAAARFDLLGIIDADGTYPPPDLPRLIRALAENDMVVAAR